MSKRITRSSIAALGAVLLLLVLAGQALGDHGPRHNLAVGTTSERIHITTHPQEESVVETFTLDFGDRFRKTGWHSHPGSGLVTITAGSFVLERVTPSGCIERIPYGVGDTFVEGGGAAHQLVLDDDEATGKVHATFVTPAGHGTGAPAPEPVERESC